MASRDDLLGGVGKRAARAPAAAESRAGEAEARGSAEGPVSGAALNELFLIKLRYKVGRQVEVGGNKPLSLSDGDTVWVVNSGKIDVFAVQMENGQPVGPRTHLFRAETGHALFGMAPAAQGRSLGLLAVGAAGTQVLKLAPARLRGLLQQGTYANEVAGLLDHWAADLAAGLSREMTPKEYALLEPGGSLSIADGQIARPRDGVLWVRVVEGTLRLLGRESLTLACGSLYPIDRHFWMQASGTAAVEVMDAKAFMACDAEGFALDAFHKLILDFLEYNARNAEQVDRERLARHIAADRRQVQSAVANLAGVLAGDVAPVWAVEGGAMDRLLAACTLVGQAQGITIAAPASMQQASVQRDPLGAIARASRMRMRRVSLRGKWWRFENGPLLAYTLEHRHPVAIIPAGRGYELHDPENATRAPVTETIAETLEPAGYTFYRPFPDRALTAVDLIRFGIRGCQNDLLVVLLIGFLGGALGTLTPLATAMIFDTIIPGAERGQLSQLTVGLFVAAVAAALFQATRSLAMLRVEGRMDASIQAAVWDRLLSLPVPFFQQYSAGDLSARAMGVNVIRQTLSGMVVASVLSILFSSFNFVLLFYYDSQLAMVATGLVLVAATATVLAGYWQMRYRREMANLQGHISGMVVQFVAAIAKLRVAGVEGHAFGFWAREFSRQKQMAYRARMVENALNTFNSSYPILTFIAIFATYSFMSTSKLTTGAFLGFNAAFAQFLAAALSVSGACLAIVGIIPIYERARPILDARPEVDQAKTDPGELAGAIEVNHVSFHYGDKGPPVLEDVSLQIEPGEFVALVGPSGSGKSTLFRLLLGFETPTSGAIYYDGKDLGRLDVRGVRRQIGVVLQNGRLSPGDVFTNIVGSSGLGLDDAWDAANMVGLDEDIRRMPMGMHTTIGEGGGTLSGGQRQRLLIARAIVTRPRIIFFDEATSALDNRTQAIVSESLERLEATRVVIAHRLSTIMHADRIFVIEKGKLAQSGTYHELMSQHGPFQKLAKRQLA